MYECDKYGDGKELFHVFLPLKVDALNPQPLEPVEPGTGVDLFRGTYVQCRDYLRRGETYLVGDADVSPVITRWSEWHGSWIVYRTDIENVIKA